LIDLVEESISGVLKTAAFANLEALVSRIERCVLSIGLGRDKVKGGYREDVTVRPQQVAF